MRNLAPRASSNISPMARLAQTVAVYLSRLYSAAYGYCGMIKSRAVKRLPRQQGFRLNQEPVYLIVISVRVMAAASAALRAPTERTATCRMRHCREAVA